MPNNEEERRKLAKEELELVFTDLFRMYLNLVKARDDYSVEMVLPEFLSEVTDRIIKYYEPIIQQAREEERKEIGSWLDCQNSWKHNRLVTERQIESLKQGKTPFERKYISGKSLKGE